MILANATWKEVEGFNRESVVIIPTGSLEQHGPHLPLFTDSLLASHVAAAIERALPDKVVLTPCLWLGASAHHLKFPGTLSASMPGYFSAVQAVIESLIPHRFTKFYVINGHGGNNEPNGVALRELKAKYPNLTFGHSGYYQFGEEATRDLLEGRYKTIRHACEAEASMMMAIHPDLVRTELLRNDGLAPQPALRGVIHHFDEFTQEGSLGTAKLATADKGAKILEACIAGAVREIEAIADGYVLVEQEH